MQEKKSLNKITKGYFVIIVLLIIFLLGIYLGRQAVHKEMASEVIGVENQDKEFLARNVDFDLFFEVWDLVGEKFYKQPVTETEMFYGALKGMVASVDDPYTLFLDPKLTGDFMDSIQGTFEGIGAEIGIRHDALTVITPLKGSPAINAGLRSGDIIAEIDETDTFGMPLEEAVGRIRGEKGTTVILMVYRENATELLEIPIIRDTIEIENVTWEVKEDTLGYIEIYNFNGETHSLVKQAIKELIEQEVTGIILDLRNNPGGYLDSAIYITSKWVGKGEIVLKEKKSDGTIINYESQEKATLKGFDTVVLINGGSASGSEILAGALQDYGLATLVGTKTFGKGSVQEYIPLEDGSSVKITVAQWFTPNDRQINEIGIEPDIEVEYTEEDINNDYDPQLDAAIEILLQK